MRELMGLDEELVDGEALTIREAWDGFSSIFSFNDKKGGNEVGAAKSCLSDEVADGWVFAVASQAFEQFHGADFT
jgi:hypothetical protein